MISCLMVTRPTPGRVVSAVRSIADYCRQTHAARELVIVVDRGDPADVSALSAHVRSLGRDDIRLVPSPGDLALGGLRNLSVAHAAGEMICQWDDDDRYHPNRLERQLTVLDGCGHAAVFLQDIVQYFPRRAAIHVTNWRATPAGGHPGTLMARRAAMIRYPERGDRATRGEDLAVALALIERGAAAYLRGEPHLHVYVSHGANTWDDAHHDMLAARLAVSTGLLRRRESDIRAGLAPFGFPADTIDVIGNSEIAFRL